MKSRALREQAVVHRLIDFLQASDFAGVIFSRSVHEGTFPLEAVGYAATNNFAPDVMISLRWSEGENTHGVPGMLIAMDGTPGKGSHSSLSRFDMNNTLVAAGPDFKRGWASDIPSGNIDVAPTILWLLGVKPPQPMDGRVLYEALSTHPGPLPKVNEQRIEATRESGLFRWQQYLKFSEVAGTRYFAEGNGRAVPKGKAGP